MKSEKNVEAVVNTNEVDTQEEGINVEELDAVKPVPGESGTQNGFSEVEIENNVDELDSQKDDLNKEFNEHTSAEQEDIDSINESKTIDEEQLKDSEPFFGDPLSEEERAILENELKKQDVSDNAVDRTNGSFGSEGIQCF